MSNQLSAVQPGTRPRQRFPLRTGTIHRPGPASLARSYAMLDIAYLVIGGLILAAFVLYTLACDRL
jgi:hypothetical protein